MCGIVTYKGKNKCLPFLLEGLKLLEYRGYDSAGVSIMLKYSLLLYKSVGSIDDLKNKISNPEIEAYMGIGHTRWAAHGSPCRRNAHPHMTEDCRLSLVHNGIIENYESLKEPLKDKYKFLRDTDSEVLLYLIYNFLQKEKDLFKSVKCALKKVVGAYAIALIDRDTPSVLIIARKGSPVVIGVGSNETFIASDRIAFENVIYLKDNSICKIGDKIESNIKEIQAHKGKVLTISSNSPINGDYKIRVSSVVDCLGPIIGNIPCQLFSYYSAKLRGKDVDKPRNLAKSITME